jgi:L-rhamnose isomerase
MQVAGSKENLKERLSRYRQIKISVIGRKSGKTISIPVWFVVEGETLYLLFPKNPAPRNPASTSRSGA